MMRMVTFNAKLEHFYTFLHVVVLKANKTSLPASERRPEGGSHQKKASQRKLEMSPTFTHSSILLKYKDMSTNLAN